MPDYERLLDSLELYVSTDKSYTKGFQDGKTKARKQIAYLALAFSLVWIVVSVAVKLYL